MELWVSVWDLHYSCILYMQILYTEKITCSLAKQQ